MSALLPEQVEALRELREICDGLGIDIVVIGAMALRIWLPDVPRLTEDVDIAVALDLNEFASLAARLTERGWRADPRWEPRWQARGGARVDLLPVGPRARHERQITWPLAETVMRVVGYDGVFTEAVRRELASGFDMRVAPLQVLALLKLTAYLDSPSMRQKDLGDVLLILDKYAEDGERRFGDEVLDAGLQYDEAGAFLLGHDLRALCVMPEDADTVRRFLQRVMGRDFQFPIHMVRWHATEDDANEGLFGRQFRALARGFDPAGA
jgi:predicted nucleotidyltransferase